VTIDSSNNVVFSKEDINSMFIWIDWRKIRI